MYKKFIFGKNLPMQKFYLRIISDTIFYSFLIFTLLFTFSSYFILPKGALVLSITISLISCIFVVKLLIVKDSKKKVKSAEKQEYLDTISTFLFMTKSDINDFFEKFINSFSLNTERKKNAIYIPDKKIFLFIRIDFEQVNKTDIIRYFNILSKNQTAIIVAEKFSTEIISFASRFDNKIKLVDGEELFYNLKKHSNLPKISYPSEPTIKDRPNPFDTLLNKKRAKNFLLFGLLFLFFGYFVPLKTYYVICGSIFIILSMICRMFGKEVDKETKV